MITSKYNIYIHALYSCTYYNYLLIKVKIVKILVLSIVSIQLVFSKSFSSDFKVCFYIVQSTFWLIWILSNLTLFLAFQIDHLDIQINVFNRSSCLPPHIEPTHHIFFSYKLIHHLNGTVYIYYPVRLRNE